MNLSNEHIIHKKVGDVEYLQFRKLLEYEDVITHAFSIGKEVDFRTIKKSNYDKAMADYEKLCICLGLDKNNIVKPNQMHQDKIEKVNAKILKEKPDIYLEEYLYTDGLITQTENLILATTSADCILMLFFDPVTKTIGNIHSGWRGSYLQIAEKAVQKMKNDYNVKPENLICCMCPSIRKCHFEVQEDVKNMFEDKFKNVVDTEKIIERNHEKEGKWNIDTVLLNTLLLQKQGLKPENIVNSQICTVCNCENLHSYRVEKENFGLETAIITKNA